ncbi:CBS domain-containing protein [Pseudomonas sp. ISL-84]|nr:CBS domain-containing protein [Pseudomonas sp. ISL-84]
MTMNQNPSKLYNLEAVRFHPFFRGVDSDTALSLISLCEVRQFEKNEIMLKKDKPREGLLLILEGLSEVFVKNETHGREEVLEVVQKGEMIGFSSLADFLGVSKPVKTDVMVEVKAVSAVRAMYIPFEVVTRRWDDPAVHDYLLTQVAIRLKDIYTSLAEQVKLATDYGENEAFMIRVQDVMSEGVAAVLPEESVQKAARLMHKMRTSSVLVIENELLKGIITERDMVERVVARGIELSAEARTIMTPDPVSISRSAYYYDAISLIFLKGFKHLPVVEDSKVVGIVTLSDLLRKKNENVMKTIQKIEQADRDSLPQVKNAIYEVIDTLIRDRVPILTTFEIITKLYDRLAGRIVELSIKNLQEKGMQRPGDFAFYQMGSSGRGEQFMLTDQDHFLVYENHREDASAYFSELGREITSNMEAAGYVRCKGLMMCSEQKWRGSLAVWEDRLRKWMLQSTNSNLLLAQNFFSYRFITGSERLHEKFERMIAEQMKRSRIFLYRLAQLEKEHPIPTLDQPIRSLFKLERKSIDMKKEVLFPYHHSLQILSLLHGKQSGTPVEKIDYLKKKQVISREFALDLKEAVSTILTMYVTQRWQQAKAGSELTSVVSFARLSTREKEELILSLKTLRELQSQVFIHFSV